MKTIRKYDVSRGDAAGLRHLVLPTSRYLVGFDVSPGLDEFALAYVWFEIELDAVSTEEVSFFIVGEEELVPDYIEVDERTRLRLRHVFSSFGRDGRLWSLYRAHEYFRS